MAEWLFVIPLAILILGLMLMLPTIEEIISVVGEWMGFD